MNQFRDKAVREQQAFNRQQRLALRARVRHAAEINRDMTWELLAERFRMDAKTIGHWCADLPRDLDWYGDGRGRRGAP